MNGVDAILQAIAIYKSRDPITVDEEEMVENLIDCLCCLSMPLENKEKFVKAEAVELMIMIMNQKKFSSLDFAMTNCPPACESFVDVMGLKTAFLLCVVDLEGPEEKERAQSKIQKFIAAF